MSLCDRSLCDRSLCFCPDDYIRELQEDRACVVWSAGLSDGRTVWMDDGRPGREQPAWIRLAHYLSGSELAIVAMGLHFRSQHRELPAGADGYYFARGIMMSLGQSSCDFLVAGHLVGTTLHLTRFSSPALVEIDRVCRPASRSDSLILNPWSDPGLAMDKTASLCYNQSLIQG